MKIFNLPDLGEGLPDAEIHEWHVKEGDVLEADQTMVAMETAKAVVEVPAPRSGKIVKLYGKPGDIIKTGAPLVEFAGDEHEAEKASSKRIDSGTVVGSIETSDAVLKESATGIKVAKLQTGIRALPAVRALAKRLGVDLAQITPTGPNNTISLQDVENASGPVVSTTASTATTEELGADFEAIRGVRRTMAQVMAQSHQQVVPVTILDDADIYAWQKGTDITLRVIRALAAGCKAEPSLNAWYDGQHTARRLFNEVHIGLAMDSPDGLFVPVLRDVTGRDASAIREDINRYKTQVGDRSIPSDDLKGYTIMLSNFGTFAGRYANPVIVPPCVAILGTGRIREEAVAHEGAAALHKVIPLSLTFDHRAVTGGEATRFLGEVIRDLQTAK